MENISYEQLAAFGAIGLVVFSLAILIIFLVMAGTLKLCISWIGNRNPSFIACIGWLTAITFVNSFLIFGAMVTFGQNSLLLVTPLTWFVTLYMISQAGDCGLFRAFGIWIANSVLSSVGMVAVMLVAAIPLAMMGDGIREAAENLEGQFEQAGGDLAVQQLGESTSPIDGGPVPTEVSFQSIESPESSASFPTPEVPVPGPAPGPISDRNAKSGSDRPDDPKVDPALGPDVDPESGNPPESGDPASRETQPSNSFSSQEAPLELNAPQSPTRKRAEPSELTNSSKPRAIPAPRKSGPLMPSRVKKAPDGSTLNPFFKN